MGRQVQNCQRGNAEGIGEGGGGAVGAQHGSGFSTASTQGPGLPGLFGEVGESHPTPILRALRAAERGWGGDPRCSRGDTAARGTSSPPEHEGFPQATVASAELPPNDALARRRWGRPEAGIFHGQAEEKSGREPGGAAPAPHSRPGREEPLPARPSALTCG